MLGDLGAWEALEIEMALLSLTFLAIFSLKDVTYVVLHIVIRELMSYQRREELIHLIQVYLLFYLLFFFGGRGILFARDWYSPNNCLGKVIAFKGA